MLQISESRPVITIRKAALKNRKSYLESLSPNMMMGQTPDVGTRYNKILLNERIIASQVQASVDFSNLISLAI